MQPYSSQPPPNYPSHPPPQKSSSFPIWLVVILGLVGAVVVIGGTLAILAIAGTRKYIANAKTAEAKNSVGHMAKDAAAAYELEEPGPTLGTPVHRLCPSASRPVPTDDTMVSGRKYQSSPSDWELDKGANAGFSCLKFEMSMPQYYQYDYKRTGSGVLEGDTFEGIARGDLNGDHVYSTFKSTGMIQGGRVNVAPSIVEISPDE